MHDRPILEVRDTQNFFERLAIRKVNHGIIKFFATDKINRRTVSERLLGKHADMRPDKRNLDLGIGVLDGLARRMSPGKPGVLVNSTRNS